MKTGRPPKYRPEYCRQAKELCLLGAIDKDLATFFQVSDKTVSTWKILYPAFLQALKEGKGEADGRVRRSLFQRATGYSHPDVHISNFKGKITQTAITKRYPPETLACIFWLKNRDPDQWRDQTNVKHDIDFSEKINQAQETLEEKLNAAFASRDTEGSGKPH